jgi:hypothetical protein
MLLRLAATGTEGTDGNVLFVPEVALVKMAAAPLHNNRNWQQLEF